MIHAQDKVQRVLSILTKYGADSCCKKCTVLSHSYQTGLLAVGKDYEDELIIAAFLHDIGHLCPLYLSPNQYEKMSCHGLKGAEKWGQFFLEEIGFSEKITHIVGNIINAKRYLCSKSSNYFHTLSKDQQEIFSNEGGLMSHEEMNTFENDTYFTETVNIRKLDDQANLPYFQITENHQRFFEHILLVHLSR